MSSTYITQQGDTWDQIAHDTLGDEYLMGELLKANGSLIDYFIFPAGIEITVPDIEDVYEDDTDEFLPDWRTEDPMADDTDSDDDDLYDDVDDDDADDEDEEYDDATADGTEVNEE